MKWNNIIIKTNYIYPPIPIRDFDWSATLDGYEENSSLYGYGKTEQEAINELVENCEEYFEK